MDQPVQFACFQHIGHRDLFCCAVSWRSFTVLHIPDNWLVREIIVSLFLFSYFGAGLKLCRFPGM